MAVETQANEPGFVLSPCPFCGGEVHMRRRSGTKGSTPGTRSRFYREHVHCEKCGASGPEGKAPNASVRHWNRCASAPIVPAPAYGVKALEWTNIGRCVGWTAEDERTHLYHAQSLDRLYEVARGKVGWWARWQGAFHAQELPTLDEAKAACQADFERRILSCLSSAPVEEADAKAVLPKLENCGRYLAQNNTGHWFYINHANTWQAFQGPDNAPSRWAQDQAEARDLSTIPSEPEAKGEAGAGPVGEAVDEGTASITCPKDGKECVWYPSGGCCQPVDEPGEVERITRERDAARAERDQALYFFHHRDFREVGLSHPNDGVRHCTGLNLDRLAAAKRLREAGLVTIEDSGAGPMVAWAPGRGAALSTQESSAPEASR